MGWKKGIKKSLDLKAGERNGAGDGNELSSFVRTGAHKPLAYRDTLVSLSLVVKPAVACSLPFLCVWGEKWSKRRESNPHEKLGKLSFYHWITLAPFRSFIMKTMNSYPTLLLLSNIFLLFVDKNVSFLW